ncbi:hypothetical protein [Mucilaginibacter sp.]|uniref:hypothetical protein n=1 Tax=Mucilaginibacter sp. TaxID=1882438 RepID=UPI003D140633
MKKSKTIKLVLITGLLGAGNTSQANVAHKLNSLYTRSTVKKTFKSNHIEPVGYYSALDTSSGRRVSSGGFFPPTARRGGFGFFGHYSHSGS